jgi:aryl-alcohol dehydrogenase-like predicted oxidoreductase
MGDSILSRDIVSDILLPQRAFGSAGINLSVIGLGTVKLGRNQGVKYPTQFTIPDDQAAAELIALAKSLGINLIDTAPAYGNSEERLGTLLNRQRHEWIICSKVGEEFSLDANGNAQSQFDFSPAHTRFSIERSLKRLNTDYLDIVMAHSDGNDEYVINQTGVIETLAELKREGKIRAFGVSTKTVAGGILAAEKTDGVMATLNLDYREELPVFDYCAQHHKGILIKKAFASGHLNSASENPVRDSLALALAQAATSSVIIGTINPQHLRENITALLSTL